MSQLVISLFNYFRSVGCLTVQLHEGSVQKFLLEGRVHAVVHPDAMLLCHVLWHDVFVVRLTRLSKYKIFLSLSMYF